jgi:hypothetical protein
VFQGSDQSNGQGERSDPCAQGGDVRYKHELDPEGIPQFGLVAEEVEKVNLDLVARDEQGKPYSVRYEALNAMLLNEFLNEHRTVKEQKATIAQLKAAAAKQEATTVHQQKQIEALITPTVHRCAYAIRFTVLNPPR